MTKSLHTAQYAALIRVLVEARKESGLTQQEVADRLGKPQSYIAKLEGGERRLDVVEFVALVNAMNSEPTALFAHLLGALETAGDQ